MPTKFFFLKLTQSQKILSPKHKLEKAAGEQRRAKSSEEDVLYHTRLDQRLMMIHGLLKTGLMEQSSLLSPDCGDAEEGEGPEFASRGIISDATASAGSGSCSQIDVSGRASGMMTTVGLEVEPQPHTLEVAARYRLETRRPKRGTRHHVRREAAVASVLCVCVATMVLQAPAASAYLIKSQLYWKRVGAFPQYLTEPSGGHGGSWPISTLCYNGPDCAPNMPDYMCNPDCGNPNISIVNATAYSKPLLVRFVSTLSESVRSALAVL